MFHADSMTVDPDREARLCSSSCGYYINYEMTKDRIKRFFRKHYENMPIQIY